MQTISKNSTRLGLLTVGLSGLFAHAPLATAQDSCDAVIQRLCQNDKDNRCLEALYACGEYDQLLGRFTGQLKGLKAEEQYFIGVSYLGIADRERAMSVKCSYNGYGKSALAGFLSKAQESYGKYGNYGDSNILRYVYHATRSLDISKKLEGCHEDGHTQATINEYAKRYAQESLKTLFIGGGDSRKDLKIAYTSLMERMGSFVTSASNVETKLALSQLEIDFANKQLDNMTGSIESDIGPTNLQPQPGEQVFSRSYLNDLAKTVDRPVALIDSKEQEFRGTIEACKTMDPGSKESCADIYAQNKVKTVTAARRLIAEGANLAGYSEKKFPNTSQPFGKFTELSSSGNKGLTVGQIQNKLVSIWQEYGRANKFCEESVKPWYCENSVKIGSQP